MTHGYPGLFGACQSRRNAERRLLEDRILKTHLRESQWNQLDNVYQKQLSQNNRCVSLNIGMEP